MLFAGVAVTFRYYGHSVNVLSNDILSLSKDDWDKCIFNGTQVTPNKGQIFDEKPGFGSYVFRTSTPGTYYLACGLGVNETTRIGYHCNGGTMKATIHVLDN